MLFKMKRWIGNKSKIDGMYGRENKTLSREREKMEKSKGKNEEKPKKIGFRPLPSFIFIPVLHEKKMSNEER